LAKSITIEIRRVENGYEATINKGGRWNPIPLGRRRYVGALEEVLELATKRVKEVFKE